MEKCSLEGSPIINSNILNKLQCLINDTGRGKMWSISYASIVGSLNYGEVCMCPDLLLLYRCWGVINMI